FYYSFLSGFTSWKPLYDVLQFPSVLMAVKGSDVQLNCTHKKDSTFVQMYWYRQRPGQTMTLIVFTKDDFTGKVELKGDATKSGSLTIKYLSDNDSAVSWGFLIWNI
uniref:Immunoglobulin V-set domain-containing protein n=1 Tax=Cyprinus carpio carpio TaxID=630221 RepID=A0A9J8DKV6_CYPCA